MKATIRRRLGSVLFLAVSPLFYGPAQADDGPGERILRNHAAFLNELSDRRRVNNLFPNEQSPFYGLPVRYVNSRRGNLSFVRRDLVAVGRIPIVVARVHDSSLKGADFGQGWHLSLAESMVRHADGTLTYLDDSASELRLVPRGTGYVLEPPGPNDIASIEASGDTLRVTARSGWTKRFARSGDRFLLVQVRDAYGNALALRYRGGKLSRIEGRNGRFVAVVRDASGRVQRVVDDQRRSVEYGYGTDGQLERVVDLGGHVWRYEYDGLGRLKRALDPRKVPIVEVGFRPDGRVGRARMAGAAYRYEYEPSTTRITDEAGRVTVVAHDDHGLATSLTNANGFRSELVLDHRNRVTTLLHQGDPRAAFTYRADGAVETLTRYGPTGPVEIRYEYDAAGRPTRSTGSDGSDVLLVYNAWGDVVRKLGPEGAEELEYTPQGDLSSVTRSGQTTLYRHNASGQIESMEGARGSTRLYYLPDGKLRSIRFADGSAHELQYNRLGFRTRVERSDGTHSSYEYDPAGNLIRSTGHQHNAGGESYGQTFSVNLDNQPERIAFTDGHDIRIGYDAHGNPLTLATSDDPQGPPLRYVYDDTNRLVAVHEGENVLGRYVYDDTEPDLRVQMDDGTMRVASGAVRHSASVGDLLSIAYTRPYGSMLGAVRFDEATRTFDLPSASGLATRDALPANSLARRKLAGLESGQEQARVDFDRPLNTMFVPPEYATINCGTNCIFKGVIVRGNGVTGTLTVPAGSTVNFTASKVSGSSCTRLICNWWDNSLPMGLSAINGGFYTFTTPGTHDVAADCECSPCDLLGGGFIRVLVTPAPPPPPGPPVMITYTTFIPLDHVRLTPPVSEYFYEADNVAAYTPGVHRVEQTLTVRPGQGIVTPSSGHSAVSRLFLQNSPNQNLTTSGTCYRKHCPECSAYPAPFFTAITFDGHCLIRSATDRGAATALDMTTVQAELIGAGHYDANRSYVTVRLRGAPKIGISPNFFIGATSPAIDWNVTITLVHYRSTGATTYSVSGVHDGFPYHNIRLNSTQVWQFDPMPNGQTPLSLFPPAEIAVSTSGTLP